MSDYVPHFGYTPNPKATQEYVAGLQYKSLMRDLPWLMAQTDQQDTFLWKALLKCSPSWKRGAQAIGDCVSWGAELACTILLSLQAVAGETVWTGEVATEAIYGLRCENDRQFCNLQDGWWGSGPAEALQKWGVLLRLDYSKETGNPEHDLRIYSGDKAKQWGRYGCGGKDDNGKLDALAKLHPVKGVVPIRNVEEAVAAIQAGSTITVASNVGYGSMKRDSEGIVRRSGSWGHQMMFAGVKFIRNEPFLHQFQSWGKSCSGPFPGVTEQAILDCSWLTSPEDANTQFKADDSFAFARVEGFDQPRWSWEDGFFI